MNWLILRDRSLFSGGEGGRLLGLLCVMSKGITLSKNSNNGDTQLDANIFNYKIPRGYTRLCLFEILRILHVRRYKMIQNTLHVSNTWHYVWGEGHNFFSFTLGRAIFLKMRLRAGPRFFKVISILYLPQVLNLTSLFIWANCIRFM